MVSVIEVKTRKQQKDFLNFPLELYKDNPYFVPPIYMDEKQIFNKKYVYYETSEAVYFNAYKDNKIVGRISAILQKESNKKWNQKRVRFTRFDSIDDKEVAKALFLAVENYAKKNNMEEVVGPLGFSDLEREGLLIEGFDYLSTYEEQYNYSYYQKLIENCGYQKDVDWLETRLFYPKEVNQKLFEVSSKMLKKYGLTIARTKTTKQFIKRYADQFFEILDKTYSHLYGTVPFTEKVKKMMIDNFKLIVNVKHVAVIVDKEDKVVCFGVAFPAIGKIIQKSKGHLHLLTIIKLLRYIKKPKQIDLGLIGVLPEYAKKGIASALIGEILNILKDNNLEYAETNLNLEDNYHILNQWKYFDSIQHKRRRCYIKKI